MQHVSDWIQAILEMAETKRWPTSEEPQSKRGTRGDGVQQNILTTVHSNVEKSELNGEPKVCEKYEMAVGLITGDDAKSTEWANRRPSQLRTQQRNTLAELTGLKFTKAKNGKYKVNARNS